jgi:hypothetical protein
MSSLFISYRRADAQGWAGRLAAGLGVAFGEDARFFDLRTLGAGVDFRAAIEGAIAASEAALVLIGPRWLDIRDEAGLHRIDHPEDLVRIEVASALAKLKCIVPVLLGGATMPEAARLPRNIRRLARLNAFELSDLRWEHDLQRLLVELEARTSLRRVVAAPHAGVSVGAGLELTDGEVGRVVGVSGAAPPAGSIEVLRGARVDRGRIGDIVGLDASPAPASRDRRTP